MPPTRAGFQQLADIRVHEASALVAAGMWEGAYYLAGYAVECALKACITKQIIAEDFPDKEKVNQWYSHKIDVLLAQALLEPDRLKDAAKDLLFKDNWSQVMRWSEKSRYTRPTEAEARAILEAITDPVHGVLRWIKSRW